MKTRIINIGNSRGVRIPKPLLKQSNLEGDIYLFAKKDCIVIKSANLPRSGWQESFESMAAKEDDKLQDSEIINSDWDSKNWQWS